jgi:hypothetical protein
VGNSPNIDDCSGETLIPKSYLKAHYAPYLLSFEQDVPDVDQSVVVFRKPQNKEGTDAENDDRIRARERAQTRSAFATTRARLLGVELELKDERAKREAGYCELSEQRTQIAQLTEQLEGTHSDLSEQRNKITQLSKQLEETRNKLAEAHDVKGRYKKARKKLRDIRRSRSWRLTAPLRKAVKEVRGLAPSNLKKNLKEAVRHRLPSPGRLFGDWRVFRASQHVRRTWLRRALHAH